MELVLIGMLIMVQGQVSCMCCGVTECMCREVQSAVLDKRYKS